MRGKYWGQIEQYCVAFISGDPGRLLEGHRKVFLIARIIAYSYAFSAVTCPLSRSLGLVYGSTEATFWMFAVKIK